MSIYKEMGQRTGAVYFAPLVWAQHMVEAHFDYIDKMFIAAMAFGPFPQYELVRRD
jgi:hypothetical protein